MRSKLKNAFAPAASIIAAQLVPIATVSLAASVAVANPVSCPAFAGALMLLFARGTSLIKWK